MPLIAWQLHWLTFVIWLFEQAGICFHNDFSLTSKDWKRKPPSALYSHWFHTIKWNTCHHCWSKINVFHFMSEIMKAIGLKTTCMHTLHPFIHCRLASSQVMVALPLQDLTKGGWPRECWHGQSMQSATNQTSNPHDLHVKSSFSSLYRPIMKRLAFTYGSVTWHVSHVMWACGQQSDLCHKWQNLVPFATGPVATWVRRCLCGQGAPSVAANSMVGGSGPPWSVYFSLVSGPGDSPHDI